MQDKSWNTIQRNELTKDPAKNILTSNKGSQQSRLPFIRKNEQKNLFPRINVSGITQ